MTQPFPWETPRVRESFRWVKGLDDKDLALRYSEVEFEGKIVGMVEIWYPAGDVDEEPDHYERVQVYTKNAPPAPRYEN